MKTITKLKLCNKLEIELKHLGLIKNINVEMTTQDTLYFINYNEQWFKKLTYDKKIIICELLEEFFKSYELKITSLLFKEYGFGVSDCISLTLEKVMNKNLIKGEKQ